MVDFNSVLDQARQLSPDEQGRLINALWELVPDDLEVPLHPEWSPALEERVARLRAGSDKAIPWARIHEEALARLQNGIAD